MSDARFKGSIPAIVTPFNDKQELKEKTVCELMDWQFEQGVNGFYICGGMGEGLALRNKTRMQMAEVAVDKAKGKGVIINHIGAANILDTIELVRHAAKIGCNAVASLAPSHFYPYCEDEVVNYYKIISDNTDLPVFVYATALLKGIDIPKLVEELIKIRNVVGVKCTMGDYFLLRKLKEINGGDITIFDGDDHTLLCGLVMGADGGIGASYSIMPSWFCKLYDAYMKGDIKTAQEYQYRINKVIAVLIKYGGAKAVKPVLEMMGFEVGGSVLPGMRLTAEQRRMLKIEIAAAGIEL